MMRRHEVAAGRFLEFSFHGLKMKCSKRTKLFPRKYGLLPRQTPVCSDSLLPSHGSAHSDAAVRGRLWTRVAEPIWVSNYILLLLLGGISSMSSFSILPAFKFGDYQTLSRVGGRNNKFTHTLLSSVLSPV